MQQGVGHFERVLGIMTATNPEKLRESHSGCGGRYRIERIAGVDISADFEFCCRRREQRMDQRGAAGAIWADDFRDSSAGESIDNGIEGRQTCGKSFPDSGFWTESESSAQSGVRVHASSPFLRLMYFALREGGLSICEVLECAVGGIVEL